MNRISNISIHSFDLAGTFIVFIIGFCGNVLCLGVLCRRRRFSLKSNEFEIFFFLALIRNSYTQYLIALAIVDTGAICSESNKEILRIFFSINLGMILALAAFDELYQHKNIPGRALIQHNGLSCKLYYYIRFIFYTMSSW